MTPSKNRHRIQAGFTLIELLVVVFILALVLAVLAPALAVAKEHCKRTVCLANIHQFLLGIHVYAEGNDYRLPPSGIDETFRMLTVNYVRIEESIGNDKCMFCPSLGEPFIKKSSGGTGGYFLGNDGHSIGYNYLGGQSNTPWPLAAPATKKWKSPQLSTCKMSVPIITELNVWSIFHDKTVAPHGKRGPVRQAGDYMNTGSGGITSEQIGADGGNIGFIDGSGHWKHIEDMKIYVINNSGPSREWFSVW